MQRPRTGLAVILGDRHQRRSGRPALTGIPAPIRSPSDALWKPDRSTPRRSIAPSTPRSSSDTTGPCRSRSHVAWRSGNYVTSALRSIDHNGLGHRRSQRGRGMRGRPLQHRPRHGEPQSPGPPRTERPIVHDGVAREGRTVRWQPVSPPWSPPNKSPCTGYTSALAALTGEPHPLA
jgi:hypothetical protein